MKKLLLAGGAILALLVLVPKPQRKLPPFMAEQSGRTNGVYEAVFKITASDGHTCSAFAVSNTYALTAEHCVTEGELYDIRSSRDDETKLYAEAVRTNEALDVALLKGDFTLFNTLVLNQESLEFMLDVTPFLQAGLVNTIPHIVCGFPNKSKQVFCSNFILHGKDQFFVAGEAIVFPGMSGGPVFNKETMEVVGVTRAAGGRNDVYASSVFKVFDLFDVEVVTE